MSQDWAQHALARTGWRPRNQAVTLAVLGVIIALIFGGVYLSQVGSYAITTRQIEELLVQRDQLEFTNEQLRAEIANLQTVPRLLTRAQELGFRPATSTDIEYLVVDGYNPARSDSVVPLEARAEAIDDTPVYDETFSGWLQLQLDSLRRQFENFGQ